ncbi:hypothetical protein ACFXTO_029717 [Malus domestica]
MDGRCTVLIKKPTTISQSSIQILIHQGCKRFFPEFQQLITRTTKSTQRLILIHLAGTFVTVDFGWGKPVFAGPARSKWDSGTNMLAAIGGGGFQQELKRMTMEPVEDNTKPVRIKSTL